MANVEPPTLSGCLRHGEFQHDVFTMPVSGAVNSFMNTDGTDDHRSPSACDSNSELEMPLLAALINLSRRAGI